MLRLFTRKCLVLNLVSLPERPNFRYYASYSPSYFPRRPLTTHFTTFHTLDQNPLLTLTPPFPEKTKSTLKALYEFFRVHIHTLLQAGCNDLAGKYTDLGHIHLCIFCNNLVFTICLYSNYIYILFFQILTFLRLCLVFFKTFKKVKIKKLIAHEVN